MATKKDKSPAGIGATTAQTEPALDFQPVAYGDLYLADRTSIAGLWGAGEVVTREEAERQNVDFDRLVRIGAVRRAAIEEVDAHNARLAEAQAVADDSEDRGRTAAEVAADVRAQSETGNPDDPDAWSAGADAP